MRRLALLAVVLAVLVMAGCPVLKTEIRYEVVGSGTSWVGVLEYEDEDGAVSAGPQALPWSYEFDTDKDTLFLAVQARNEDFSAFSGTVTVRILIDGDVVEADTSDFWSMATYFWTR